MYSWHKEDIRFSQILMNECMVHGSAESVQAELSELHELERSRDGGAKRAADVLKHAVEKLSAGKNSVLFDDYGIPSVMVRVDAMTCAELTGSTGVGGLHPAFRCGAKKIREVWVSKYINCLADGSAASLPMSEPACISNFNQALQSVRFKGNGWLLMPFQLRAAILLRCAKQGINPSGNTNLGCDYYARSEIGIQTSTSTVLTGSGPVAWTHDGTREGIWDLVGNLNEWDCGFRLMNGEIQLIDMEALLQPEPDLSASSKLWMAMNESGDPVQPGSAGTLHFDGHDGVVRVTRQVQEHGLGNCAFCDVTVEAGLRIHEQLKLLGLYPASQELTERSGWRWINTEGEALPLSGGAFRIQNHSGLFFMGVTKQRDVSYGLSGIRCVYIAPDAIEEA